jgi:hypothetical protein
MMSMIRTGYIVLSAMALLSASMVGAQETPAPTTPDSADSAPGNAPSDAPSDADVANMALVCVATYDLVMSKQPSGPQADAISDARDLARSIYIEATASDETTADDDIARTDKVLADAVASGKGNLDEYHSTCDSLLMGDDPDDGADTGATIS